MFNTQAGQLFDVFLPYRRDDQGRILPRRPSSGIRRRIVRGNPRMPGLDYAAWKRQYERD
jgi:hypothetical protein